MSTPPLLVDGHLDLAFNAAQGRDLTLGLEALRAADPVEGETATVTFGELGAAGTRVAFGTLFALPRTEQSPQGYTDHAGARAQALAQLDQYRRWEDAGLIRLLRGGAEVRAHLAQPEGPLGVVLLMEGADPVRDADDLLFWQEAGVRAIGPAWGRTRYAGGTAAPGPLTDAGRALVTAMRDLGLTLDASHLDDAAFWEALEIGPRVIATHANSRAFVPGNRQLTDEMARAVAATGGMIGLVFLGTFIRAGWNPSQPRVGLEELAAHARHYAARVGWEHVGLGTDLDGGFGREKAPAGVERYRDVGHFLDLLPEEHRAGVAGGNWGRWLTRHL
ncbi:peptidase M19 [Deinococcus metallilatus]|uniref:Membrane dipeptidase n=1 Tax=Deinococcus metallilatus TaxID=1211322 RepID=A0AAJ5F3A1_9DEIO|nr:membrane dipeptidase [Deinococcus metallilatus]MBB5294106.1 membrane dipeptidase [Deinococcus metallilatus]QBY08891.1 peptidase M19 [Deinococcus metallilatus]RXJ10035.1 peptidase M19 [Deinococcus metallilatus]TLK28028.1 peptidase M19 [Deinococcus metallilatus]GMA16558.1 peptidase [Deinococcus metallilatus]